MAVNINNLIAWIKLAHNVNVSNEWMQDAVDVILSAHRNCSLNHVQTEVWNKWLHTDLHLFPNLCLPKNLQTQKDQTISGKFNLQIDEIRDVSQPCYSQLMKITNQNDQNLDLGENSKGPFTKEKPSRLLRLKLSDGVENVFGMEYKPIACIGPCIPPGSKICLYGLVETLREANSQEKVLARALGTEAILSRLRPSNEQNANTIPPLRIDPPRVSDDFDDDNFPDFEELDRLENLAIQSVRRGVETNDENNEINYFDDDFIDMAEIEEMERLAMQDAACSTGKCASTSSVTFVKSAERPIPTSRRNFFVETLREANSQEKVLARALGTEAILSRLRPSNEQNANTIPPLRIDPPRVSNDFDDDFIDMAEIEEMERLAMQDAACSTGNKRGKSTEFSNLTSSSSRKRHDDVFQIAPNKEAERKKFKTSNDEKCASTSSVTFVKSAERPPIPTLRRNFFSRTAADVQLSFSYLSNIINIPVARRRKNYSVKAFFMTLTKPLDHNCESKWSLEALVNDGTASLEVGFDNKCLEDLIGFKATEIRTLSRRAKYDAEIRKKLDSGFENCKTTIANFAGVIDLEFYENDTASVIKIRELTENDVRLVDLAVDDRQIYQQK